MQFFVLISIIQFALTYIMIGVTYFTQLVHYPLYRKIKEGFVNYERSHVKRMAFIFGPIMLGEGITAIWLVSLIPSGVLMRLATTNLIMLILIWLSTFLFQVTQHQRLSIRFSKKNLSELISSNWIRFFLWTIKGVVIAMLLYSLYFF